MVSLFSPCHLGHGDVSVFASPALDFGARLAPTSTALGASVWMQTGTSAMTGTQVIVYLVMVSSSTVQFRAMYYAAHECLGIHT